MDRIALRVWLGATLFWLLVANFNIGFIAIDDYMHGIVLYIPAQFSSFAEIVEASGFRSPLPNIFLLSLSKLALGLGLEDPVWQLRFVTSLVTLLASIGLFFAIKHFELLRDKNSNTHQQLMALVGGFFFLSPLFLTRPLIESLSVSFLTLSSYFMMKAHLGKRIFSSCVFSVLFLALACVFRYQVGLWALGFFALFYFSKQKKLLSAGLGLGAILGFVFTGLPDLFIKGEFHSSLKSYVGYNLEHSSIYGTTPFYSYLLLLIGISLPPTFFYKFKNFEFKPYLKTFAPVLVSIIAFVIGHSAVPHKEERFMVPIFLLFFMLLVPFLFYLREIKSWRYKYFLALNALVILPASFNPPQINTIRLVKWMEEKAPNAQLYQIAEGNFLFPMAFSANQNLKVKTLSLNELLQKELSCNEALAVRYDIKKGLLEQIPNLKEIFVSKPGPLEQLVVWLNPGKNARRGPIYVYQKSKCEIF